MRILRPLLTALPALLMLGCPEATPPVVVPAQPLTVGGSPAGAMPLAVDEKATKPAPRSAKPRGPKAASFSLPSITTPGRASIPAEGKVVIVDFWATWCEPCKKSFPMLQELYVKYKASGLEVVAVSVDDEDATIASFARTYGATFPVVWDKDKAIVNAYQPERMPTTLIIDREGNIAHVYLGYRDGENVAIEGELKALL